MKKSAKRLTVLLWMLALMLATAVPALAQGGSQYTPSAPVGPHTPGEEVAATGMLHKLTGLTSWQYGSHTLKDSDTGTLLYALTSNSVDLDAYDGQRVTVYGTVVPGYENGLVEGGPTLLDVYRVEPLDGAGEATTPPVEDSEASNGSEDEAAGEEASNGSVDDAAGEEAARESDFAGSAAERASVQVLPDTGGTSLLILGAGTLLMAAGLLVRWR